MTLFDFNDLGCYIAKKTEYPTIMRKNIIENKYFKYIFLINNVCCIRHENDNSKKAIMYKTYTRAKKYIDKWLEKVEV